jgi:hypothetical protein
MTSRQPRSEAGDLQLTFSFVSEPARPARTDVVSRPLLQHPSRKRILKMVRFARQFFPELEGTCVRIGLARRADGYASLEEPSIWLNPRGLNYQTISHELVHLLQGRGLVPMGERSCDLFSLARDRLLVDAAPVYLQIPSRLLTSTGALRPGAPRLLHDTACQAIDRRSRGRRQYIRWFEKQLVEEV